MAFSVSWITPLVVGAVVDRNPTATKDLCLKLNRFVAEAREALRSLQGDHTQLIEVDGLPKATSLRIDEKLLDCLPEDMFVDFAGQGRLRWHRGVAHPILAGIEASYAAEQGRGWFEHGESAKAALLLPHTSKGFNVVDDTCSCKSSLPSPSYMAISELVSLSHISHPQSEWAAGPSVTSSSAFSPSWPRWASLPWIY